MTLNRRDFLKTTAGRWRTRLFESEIFWYNLACWVRE